MDEVDSLEHIDVGTDTTLDTALATHKDAVRHGVEMLACGACVAKIENMTILTFLVEKLARLCRHISETVSQVPEEDYSIRNRNRNRNRNRDRNRQQHKNAQFDHDHDDHDDGASSSISMCFGSYAVDSLEEYQLLVSGLLRVQVRNLQGLIQRLREISLLRTDSETMTRRLAAAEISLMSIG